MNRMLIVLTTTDCFLYFSAFVRIKRKGHSVPLIFSGEGGIQCCFVLDKDSFLNLYCWLNVLVRR